MPYHWSTNSSGTRELTLWPYQSLPPRGMAVFVLSTFGLICIPLFGLIGTMVLWGLLPFLLIAVGGIWFALNKSYADRSILETLTFGDPDLRLMRQQPRADAQTWDCNCYWAKATLHKTGGPVANYVTLSGNGREVEIGAFLSEEERMSLFSELQDALAARRT